MSKVSKPRPVDRKKFEKNYDAIFGKKKTKKRIVEYVEFCLLFRIHHKGEVGCDTFSPREIRFTRELLEDVDKKRLKDMLKDFAELWVDKCLEKLAERGYPQQKRG